MILGEFGDEEGDSPGFSGQRWNTWGSHGIGVTVSQLLGHPVAPDLPAALLWVGVCGQGQGASEAQGVGGRSAAGS